MRDILFRGKDSSTKLWLYGDLRQWSEKRKGICDYKLKRTSEVISETVGQYTGLTDKNGKKIFEGDVFNFPDEVWESYYTYCGTEYNSWEIENYGVVGYCEDCAGYDFVQYKHDENSVCADLHENHTIQFADFVRELEVIGNIHDNPELLGGNK